MYVIVLPVPLAVFEVMFFIHLDFKRQVFIMPLVHMYRSCPAIPWKITED